MRLSIVDSARAASVRPSDVVHAIQRGHLNAWNIGGVVVIEPDGLRKMGLDQWDWTPIAAWAERNGTYYKAVRRLMTNGEIEHVDDGPRRRWILEPDHL